MDMIDADALKLHLGDNEGGDDMTDSMMGLSGKVKAGTKAKPSKDQRHSLDYAMGAVASYCSKARADEFEKLKSDGRMPGGVNYLDRYNALLVMNDKTEVLEGLDLIIAEAEAMLDRAGELDVDAAVSEAAARYAEKIRKLDGITIADAKGWGASGSFEALEDPTLTGAESVAGNVLVLPERPAYDGATALIAVLDAERVRELAVEVRKSFETFKRVVEDNGLYAAFSTEGALGAVKGFHSSFWWDGFFDGVGDHEVVGFGQVDPHGVPSSTTAGDLRDSLDESIGRMKAYNEKRYFSLFFEDHEQHVEGFWYGLKRLVEAMNGLYRINADAFNRYCRDLAEDAEQALLAMGAASMNLHQAIEFSKAVGENLNSD